MKINNKGKGALIAAITAAATLLSCGLAAASASAAGVDYLPTIGQVPTYTKFQPTADPGKNASDYFQPYWYAKNANDNGGTHIQAHGGQVVKVGDAYYWYGEDRSVVPEFLRTLVFARPRGDDQFADCTFSPSLDMSR